MSVNTICVHFRSFLVTMVLFIRLLCSYSIAKWSFRTQVKTLIRGDSCLVLSDASSQIVLSDVLTTCYLVNRMPFTVLGGLIPHRVLYLDRPLFSHPLQVFGCTCYVHAFDHGRDNLDPHVIKCLFRLFSYLERPCVLFSYSSLLVCVCRCHL